MEKTNWEVKSHSYQIADTGDYDGHWEISNGDFALITKEDGDEIEDELNKVAASLNELNLTPDDRHKIDLYIATARTEQLQNRGEWTRVEDGLPEDGEVIDTWNGIVNRRAIFRKLSTPEQSLFERHVMPHANERVYTLHFPDVTHWQPLPEPPKQ